MANDPNLQDLNLVDEAVNDVDFANMPEGGGFPAPPQPGTYEFTLPSEFSGKMFETIQTPEGARVKVHFEDDKQLRMADGRSFRTNISNSARVRNKDGVKASDLGLLLKNGLGETTQPKSNTDYARALAKHAGEKFLADVEYSANCSTEREIYKDGKKQPGIKGCGTRFAMDSYTKKDGTPVYGIPKEGGQWLSEFECPKCKAIIRAFPNLNRFRAAK